MQQAIREIRTVEKGSIAIDLPETFWGRQLEIIILPLTEEVLCRKKSMYGCLQHYANPDLIQQEQEAWANAVKEKYENR
jgi:hypothetical protein